MVEPNLEELIREALAVFYGQEFTDEEYAEFVLPIYIVPGDVQNKYSDTVMVILFLTIAAALLFVGLYFVLQKPYEYDAYGNPLTTGDNNSFIFGLIGAILGAALGGAVWVAFGLGGTIVAYVGLLIFFASYKGFTLFCKDREKFAVLYALILSFVTVFVATFTVCTLQIFEVYNDGSMGYISLKESLAITFRYVKNFSESKSVFWANLAIGEFFTLICGISLLSKRGSRK